MLSYWFISLNSVKRSNKFSEELTQWAKNRRRTSPQGFVYLIHYFQLLHIKPSRNQHWKLWSLHPGWNGDRIFSGIDSTTSYSALQRPREVRLRIAVEDFPGGPVVKTLRCQCRGSGLSPWSGNWDPHTLCGAAERLKIKKKDCTWFGAKSFHPAYVKLFLI